MKYLHTVISFSNFLTFRVQENRIYAQFIVSMFHQTLLQVSGVSTAHHQEVFDEIYSR